MNCFNRLFVFVTVSVVFSSVIGGCKERGVSRTKDIDFNSFRYEYTPEIIPFNRLPLERLKSDEVLFANNGWPMPPRLEVVQRYQNTDYGIRVIEEDDLSKFIRAGDIAVDYSPIDDPKKMVFQSKLIKTLQKSAGETIEQDDVGVNHMVLVGLGEQGMSHAKLVTQKGSKLCHIDSPEVMSDCNWEGFMHFFRVQTDEVVLGRVNDMSQFIMSRASAYDYDAFLYTDVYVKGIPSVLRHLEQFVANKASSLPPFYCSELPFTFYSLAMGKNLFDTGFNLMDFAKQISDLRSEPKFAPFVNDEVMQQSLSAFVQQASTIPENMRPMLTGGIRQLMSDGYIGSGMRMLVKKYYPPLVLPQHFMLAAKTPERLPGSRIVYIGSLETKEAQKDSVYFSSLIVETGKIAVKNYLDRVKKWWNSNPAPSDSNGLQLREERLDAIKPEYMEPLY